MAVINPYEQKVLPQGQMNVQASPASFGAPVAQGLGEFADAMQKRLDEDDVTDAHVQAAKVRAQWQQNLNDMVNSTQPGDQTLAPRVMEGLQNQFDQMAPTFQTRAGQRAFATLSADMTSMFGQEAIAAQARLDGEFAKNQYGTLRDSLTGIAADDFTQAGSLIKQGIAAIDDPKGRFAKIPEAAREAFRNSLEEDIKFNAAHDFVRKNPIAALGGVPPELRTKLQEATSGTNGGTGTQPFQLQAAGLPPNLNAPVVKAYNQNDIWSRVQKLNAPSEFDQMFKDAGQMYNIDWRELKMRSVVESSLNPKADNGQAQGIMQFTPETAKSLGINALDPKSAIFGAAKLLSSYRQQAAGDMAKVDMMYYGGESGTQWGPNTRQYAANLAALRQSSGLGTAVDPQTFAPTPAMQVADAAGGVAPKFNVPFIDSLPGDKKFQLLTIAEHYRNMQDTQSERARVAAERAKKLTQDSVIEAYQKRIVMPNDMNGGATSEQEIYSDNRLSPDQQRDLGNFMLARERELATDATTRPHPAKFKELLNQLYASDDDPTKTFSTKNALTAYNNGEISYNEFKQIKQESAELNSGDGVGFRKQVQTARGIATNAFTRSTLGQAMPEAAAAAAYSFTTDLESKIEEYRKANKDPRSLITPGTADYMMSPERLQSYWNLNTGTGPVNNAANNTARQQAATLPTYKEYDNLKAGQSYTDPQGNVRVKR